MSQTLFAVIALGLVLFLSLNTSRQQIDRMQSTISAELESQARGVGGEILDHVAGFAFDGNAGATTPAGFTPEASFGPPGRAFDDPGIGDIDDFHRVRPFEVIRIVVDPDTGEERELAFDVNIVVRYVNVSASGVDGSGGTATFTKQVEVTVTHPQMVASTSFSRVFSFGA